MPGSFNLLFTGSMSFSLALLGPLLEYVSPCSFLLRTFLRNMRGYIFLLPYRKSPDRSVYFWHHHWRSLGFTSESKSSRFSHECSDSCICWQCYTGCPKFPYLLKEIKVKPKSTSSIISIYYNVDVSLDSENGSQMSKQ